MVDFKNGTFDLHLNKSPRRPRCAPVQSWPKNFTVFFGVSTQILIWMASCNRRCLLPNLISLKANKISSRSFSDNLGFTKFFILRVLVLINVYFTINWCLMASGRRLSLCILEKFMDQINLMYLLTFPQKSIAHSSQVSLYYWITV